MRALNTTEYDNSLGNYEANRIYFTQAISSSSRNEDTGPWIVHFSKDYLEN